MHYYITRYFAAQSKYHQGGHKGPSRALFCPGFPRIFLVIVRIVHSPSFTWYLSCAVHTTRPSEKDGPYVPEIDYVHPLNTFLLSSSPAYTWPIFLGKIITGFDRSQNTAQFFCSVYCILCTVKCEV